MAVTGACICAVDLRLVMQIDGVVSYNGETFDKFYPQRTAAYISQVNIFLEKRIDT